MTDNLNVQNIYGSTPIQHAIEKGHTEIVKILESLTGNPNAKNKWIWRKIIQQIMKKPNNITNYNALTFHTYLEKIKKFFTLKNVKYS